MTLSPAHTAIRPSFLPAPAAKTPTTGPQSKNAAEAVDTFERIAPPSTRTISATESPKMVKLLAEVKAEKSAQNKNPVFPSIQTDLYRIF